MNRERGLQFVRFTAAVVFCAALSACSESDINILLSRLDPSETIGSGNSALHLGVKATAKLRLFNKLYAGPGQRADATADGSAAPSIAYTFGVTDRFDIQVSGAADATTDMMLNARAKFQLTGAPSSIAPAGTFSMAATAGAGYSSEQHTAAEYPSGSTFKGELATTAADIALIVGYRPHQRVLFYGGPFVSNHGYEYTWSRYQNSTRVERESTHGGIITRGVTFASQWPFQQNWHMQFEIVHARVEVVSLEVTQAGFLFGRRW